MLPGVNRMSRTREESYVRNDCVPIELNESEIQFLNEEYVPVDVSEGNSE